MPVGNRNLEVVNPFHSEKVQADCLLEAKRPRTLPVRDDELGPQSTTVSGRVVQSEGAAPTGKGRGIWSSSEMPDATGPTVNEQKALRTEGRMQGCDDPVLSQGQVKSAGSSGMDEGSDGLQRALEGELVEFLRCQNSKLMQELECLKGQLQHVQMKAGSGDASSPWSAVNGTSVEGSSGNGTFPAERHGRGGSRTPRHRTRERAVSPEACEKGDSNRFTPNGTRVPKGPPPVDEPMLPPIPPFPTVAGEPLVEGTSFVSNLYDTCESKLRVKNGDVQWKPHDEKGNDAILSPQEAKQAWLEREVRSLKVALDRVAVPSTLTESGYWNPTGLGGCGADSRQDRALHGGRHGDLPQQDRAPNGGRHGDLPQQDRALRGIGELLHQDRASQGVGELLQQDRASGGTGELPHQDRALRGIGELPHQDRALRGFGELPHHDRASHGVGDLPHQDRALQGAGNLHQGRALHGGAAVRELHGLPQEGQFQRGAQGQESLGVAPMPASWESSGGGGGGKVELPSLPNGASPLEFRDWLCLCGPVMKDLSQVAGRWWDATVRQAHAFYVEWRDYLLYNVFNFVLVFLMN